MKKGLEITTEHARIDLAYVHHFLSEKSYWAKGIPIEIVEKSIQNSMCFSVFYDEKQIGIARVISDKATFAYLSDVFIEDAFRGKGFSKKLLETIMSHPDLQGIRRWILMTWDAHGLYEQFGFSLAERPDRIMEISVNDIYQKD